MRVRLEVNRRTVSLLVAGIYLVLAQLAGGLELFLRTLLFLVLPLACIWFSDTLGGGTGMTFGGGYITKPSPGFVVYFLGWVLLAMPVIAVLLSFIFNFKLLQ
jgi:hypothetical protein